LEVENFQLNPPNSIVYVAYGWVESSQPNLSNSIE
jgi:hypothetical protein